MNKSKYILNIVIIIALDASIQGQSLTARKVYAEILQGKAGNMQDVFTKIYEHNIWGDTTSFSGPGSTLQNTEHIRAELAKLLVAYNIKTINDAPCGDWNWMRMVDLSNYFYNGFDIVQKIISDNTEKHSKPHIKFHHANIITDILPQADIIICREVLQHLPNKDIFDTICNFKKSRSRYLLATNIYGAKDVNNDIAAGGCRLINLCAPPFNFPEPIAMIREMHGWADPGRNVAKEYLCLWLLDDIEV